MKYLVLKDFRDEATGRIFLAGSFYGHDDEKRMSKLTKEGFIKGPEKVETAVKAPEPEKSVKETAKKSVKKKSGD